MKINVKIEQQPQRRLHTLYINGELVSRNLTRVQLVVRFKKYLNEKQGHIDANEIFGLTGKGLKTL